MFLGLLLDKNSFCFFTASALSNQFLYLIEMGSIFCYDLCSQWLVIRAMTVASRSITVQIFAMFEFPKFTFILMLAI